MGEHCRHGRDNPTFLQNHEHEADLQLHGTACEACLAAYSTMTAACLPLGRLDQFLKAERPEEQHGFQPGRLDEHLVTSNSRVIIAFDLVRQPAFWRDQGIPDHVVYILQRVHFQNLGEIINERGQSKTFNITGNMRQSRMLNPCLFCLVLQWAMREWRTEVGHMGGSTISIANLASNFAVLDLNCAIKI